MLSQLTNAIEAAIVLNKNIFFIYYIILKFRMYSYMQL